MKYLSQKDRPLLQRVVRSITSWIQSFIDKSEADSRKSSVELNDLKAAHQEVLRLFKAALESSPSPDAPPESGLVFSRKNAGSSDKKKAKINEPPQQGPLPGEPIDIHIHFKPGWSKKKKLEAIKKIMALNAMEDKYVVKNPERQSGTRKRYINEKGEGSVSADQDVDHILDLQLGGKDIIANMWALDSSVNRSVGARIHNQIKDLPAGTRIGRIIISEAPVKPRKRKTSKSKAKPSKKKK